MSYPSFCGGYSQNFDEVKFDWSFFEYNGYVNLFVKNDDNKDIFFNLIVNNKKTLLTSKGGTWFWTPISKIGEMNETYLSWNTVESNENILVDLNMMEKDNDKNIIKSVQFVQK